MTTFTGTSGVDTADAGGPSVSGFTTGTTGDLTDATDDIFDCQAGTDVVHAGTTNDTIIGGADADTLDGGGGGDTYQFNSGNFVSGESINDAGVSGTDTIELLGNATVIDFRPGAVAGIEALLFTDLQTAQFDQTDIPTNLQVTGSVSTGQAVIVHLTSSSFTAGGWSFTDWSTNDKVNIAGRALGDTITGSNQADIITGLGGADSINGSEGGDTYQYSSTSEASGDSINDSGTTGIDRLFLFGDVDFTGVSSIANIEGVAFDAANTATFNASQFGVGLLSTAFDVTGAVGTIQTIVVQNATNFSALNWSLSNWEAFNIPTLDTLSIIGTNGADTLTGSNAHDAISGGVGADIIRGGAGTDTVDGGEGSDIYEFGVSEVGSGETINDSGTTGKDTIRLLADVNLAPATLSGIEAFAFTGAQELHINSFPLPANLEITGSNGTAQSFIVHNANGNFSIASWTLKNWENSDHVTLNGAGGIDEIIGSTRNDIINGNGDEDTLTGGRGKDTLAGGAEADTFDYNSVKDTTRGAGRDIITDFSGVNVIGSDLDLIDLSTIDAKTTLKHNQAFKFIGAHKFHHRAGELQVKYDATTDIAIVSGDRNGDGKADFQIEVHSIAALASGDFVL